MNRDRNELFKTVLQVLAILGLDGSIYVAETRTKRVVKLRPITGG